MNIHHIAIWTFQLERLREFYIRYFNGTSNEKYINVQKGFESYFILKSASNLNGNLNCSKELEHYSS